MTDEINDGGEQANEPSAVELQAMDAGWVPKEDYLKNKESNIASALRWNRANKDRKNANNKASRERHIEDARRKDKEYHAKNKESRLAAARIYYTEHKEQVANSKREWNKRNPENGVVSGHRRRARKLAAENSLTVLEWRDIKESYGGRCVYCGAKATQQDHVIPLVSLGGHTAENVAPACKHCNVTKGSKSLIEFMYYQRYLAVGANG